MEYNKEKIEIIALFVIISAAILSGAWLGFFSPGLNRISYLRKNCAELKEKIADAKEKIKNREATTQRYNNYEKKIKELERNIPDESDTSWMVRIVAGIEDDLKFKTEKIMPYEEPPDITGTAPAAENPVYAFKCAQINLRGGYHQISQFLNTLEKKGKYLQIVSLSIEGDKDSPLQHKAEIKVKYLALKQHLTE